MNILANSTGGTLASTVASGLSIATTGMKAGIDLLAHGYANIPHHNTSVLPEGSIDAFASEGAALAIDDLAVPRSSSFVDFELRSTDEISSAAGKTSYVPPAIGKTGARSSASASDKSISVGSKFRLEGDGSAISREMRTETDDPSLDGFDTREIGEGVFEDRVLESAGRFTHSCNTDSHEHLAPDGIGAMDIISNKHPTGQSKSAKPKDCDVHNGKQISKPHAESEITISFDGAAVFAHDPNTVEVASAPKEVVPERGEDFGSKIFVGAAAKPTSWNAREQTTAIVEHLIARLSPTNFAIMAREGISLASGDASISTFSVIPGPGGTTSISLTVAHRGSENSTKVHFIESDGRVEFAGAERGSSMGATQPLPTALPIPTFSPAGILRDGMVEPGHGLPGRAPHERDGSDESEAELEEQLASLVLDQLKVGPDSSKAASMLTRLNNYLVNNGFATRGQVVTPAAWIRMVRRALGFVVRSVPIFDAEGLRSVQAIGHDAAATAGMDFTTFRAWEGAFDTDFLSEQLFRTPGISDDSVEAGVTQRLESGLRKRLPAIARATVSSDFVDPAIGLAGEANLQWGIGVISAMEGVELKVRAAMDFLFSVYKKNPKAAGKGMALIIRHSTVTERDIVEQPLFERWSEAEVRSLIGSIMRSDMWEIMSQRAMRAHFSDEPHVNAFFNEAIFNANYSRAIEDLNRIDVTRVSDEVFWNAVEQTGAEETLIDAAIARMAHFN